MLVLILLTFAFLCLSSYLAHAAGPELTKQIAVRQEHITLLQRADF